MNGRRVGLKELPCRFKPRLVWPINSIRVWVNGGRVGLLGAKSSAAGAGRGGWVQLLRGSAGGLAAASQRSVQLAAQLEGMAYLACSLACRSASSLSAGQRREWKTGQDWYQKGSIPSM